MTVISPEYTENILNGIFLKRSKFQRTPIGAKYFVNILADAFEICSVHKYLFI